MAALVDAIIRKMVQHQEALKAKLATQADYSDPIVTRIEPLKKKGVISKD